jgi:glycosyltransferase involved in cell wall biosynthesis
MQESKKTKVSVLMPAYNAEKYIKEAIESILDQTFKDFEFIIIDDCSQDKTWEIIREYKERDNRIIIDKNQKNLGLAGIRNKLKKMAKGEYIAWQDADDISIETRLEKQYAFLESHPEVGIIGAYLEFFENDYSAKSIRKYYRGDQKLRKNIFLFSPVAQPVAMIRKEILDRAGDYNLKYPPAEDLDMSFRIGKMSQFANIPEVLLRYREHPNSNTFTRLKKSERSTLEIRKKYANSAEYRITLFDKVFNFLQRMTMYITPPKIRIWMFDLIRNSRIQK